MCNIALKTCNPSKCVTFTNSGLGDNDWFIGMYHFYTVRNNGGLYKLSSNKGTVKASLHMSDFPLISCLTFYIYN